MKPLLNIFSKQRKIRQNQIKPKPRIIADIHEKNSLILSELQSTKDIELEIKHLKIGDYLIPGKPDTIIERKTFPDFISSMLSKRIHQQLKNMQKYKQKILIIEGKNQNPNISPNLEKAAKGFILSICLNHQIPIIQTSDYKETSQYLITLAKQQLKQPQKISLHSRIPKNIKEQKQYIIESFPNIGPKTAENLLKHFKSIKNIINASTEELEKILKSKTNNFRLLLD